jgi:hypothetical protein
MTWWCGKSVASEVHFRMLELPTKTIAFFGVGDAASPLSKAVMSFSHFPGGAGTGCAAPPVLVKENTATSEKIKGEICATICFGDFIGGGLVFGADGCSRRARSRVKQFLGASLAIMHL